MDKTYNCNERYHPKRLLNIVSIDVQTLPFASGAPTISLSTSGARGGCGAMAAWIDLRLLSASHASDTGV